MLGTFLDKVDDLFDRRFILAYWAPLFVVLALALLGGLASTQGLAPLLKAWSALDPLLQVILPLAALIGVTVLAYILQALTAPLIRLYEGYWPTWLQSVTRHAIAEQQARRAALLKVLESRPEDDPEAALRGLHQAGAYRQLYLNYPRKEELVPPRGWATP
jgi:hypothetical protein